MEAHRETRDQHKGRLCRGFLARGDRDRDSLPREPLDGPLRSLRGALLHLRLHRSPQAEALEQHSYRRPGRERGGLGRLLGELGNPRPAGPVARPADIHVDPGSLLVAGVEVQSGLREGWLSDVAGDIRREGDR